MEEYLQLIVIGVHYSHQGPLEEGVVGADLINRTELYLAKRAIVEALDARSAHSIMDQADLTEVVAGVQVSHMDVFLLSSIQIHIVNADGAAALRNDIHEVGFTVPLLNHGDVRFVEGQDSRSAQRVYDLVVALLDRLDLYSVLATALKASVCDHETDPLLVEAGSHELCKLAAIVRL